MALKDKMPDLNSMSDAEKEAWAGTLSMEELMEFMEYLATRQGVTEGITRDVSGLEIGAIDASQVKDEPGYTPYGEESKPKEAAPPPPVSAPVAPPPAAPPRVEREPARFSEPPPPAGSTPPPWNTEPVAESRPVKAPPPPPLKETPKPPVQSPPPAAKPPVQQTPAAPPARPSAPPPTQSPPPAAKPPVQQTPAAPPARPSAPPTQSPPPVAKTPVQQTPAAPPARPSAPPPRQAALPPTPPPADDEQGMSLDWLERLSAEQGDELFNLDLTGVPRAETPAPSRPVESGMDWLEQLARTGDVGTLSEDEPAEVVTDPFASQRDPVAYLDSLARRGGADDDELTTLGGLNIPLTDPDDVEPDRYTPSAWDTPAGRPRGVDFADAANPLETLSGFAEDEGYSDGENSATSLESIQNALNSGTETPEQMLAFLNMQMDSIIENPIDLEAEEEIGTPFDFGTDDSPIVSEIPDWLKEMQPEVEAPPPGPQPRQSLESLFDALPAAQPMPDWLQQDADTFTDINAIFDDGDDEHTPVTPAAAIVDVPQIEIDRTDQWVQALEEEHTQGVQSIDVVPDWYERNVSDPSRVQQIDRQFGSRAGEVEEFAHPLIEAALPAESSLPLAQEQAIPVWMGTVDFQISATDAAPAPAIVPDVPEWISEISAEQPDLSEIPSWLLESVDVIEEPIEEEPVFVPPPAPVVVALPVAPPTPPPTPSRAPAVDGELAARLQSARDLEQGGDLESSLSEYESLIRANVGVDAVVEDLTQLVRSYRAVPTVYRVLGDGLMRQGKLQAALDTYREALNQL